MGFTRTHQEQRAQTSAGNYTRDLEFERTPSIDRILLSYSSLPNDEITDRHKKHFAVARDVLWNALDTYNDEVDNILNQPRVSEYKLQQTTDDLYRVIESARRIDFPNAILKLISFEFIDTSLDYGINLTPRIRKAVVDMGLAIGGERVLDAKVRHIAQDHLGIMKASQGKALSLPNMSRVTMEKSLLNDLGITIDIDQIPSLLSDITKFTKDHAHSVAMVGAAAMISSSILAPNLAIADETHATNISISTETNVENSAANLVVEIPPSNTEKSSTIEISVPSASADSASNNIEVTVGIGLETNKKQPSLLISTSPNTKTTKPTISVPIAVGVEHNISSRSTVQVTTPTPKVDATKNTKISTDSYNIAVPEKSAAMDGEPASTVPIAISPEDQSSAPKLDKNTATPEQLAIQTITDAINTDGDIATASSLIRLSFHDKNRVATQYKNGVPIYETTNAALAKNIVGLEISFEDLISKKGHADPNYVNNTLMALSVLDALANDQSVLSSPDVQQLIANIKRPDDEYLGKLYDQYAAKSKEAFAADNNALFTGISDRYRAQVESMYTYVLLANVTDKDQGVQIQAIKDAEAAAEAAAEKASGNYSKTPEAEAIKNLIDREQNPAKKRTYIALEYLMTNGGLTATQAAGIIGNLLVESASTMDPAIKQFNGGPAQGIAQWEAGRLNNLRKYAASKGTSWDDLETQLGFLISELPNRQNTLEKIKGTQTIFDATNTFMIRYETPRVVVDAMNSGNWAKSNAQAQLRADRGQVVLDTYNTEVQSVQNARSVAAAKAAAEAEAKKKALMIDESHLFDDSTGEKCAPGTKDAGKRTGYIDGKAVPIRVCTLPNTKLQGGSEGLVNVRASGMALAMFEQMRQDLGLDIITLNDSFRSMSQQKSARAKYGSKQAAAPGYSNHQMGYAFDINMGSANGGNSDSYVSGKDRAYPGNPVWEWLNAHAAEYHFHQYPDEGWHWSINGK